MSISFEERYRNFAQYLKEKQKRFLPAEMLEGVSDEEMLDAYRRDSKDGSYYYTKDQEKSVIMEYESNESIENALGNLQHINHREELEKKLIEEFKEYIEPINIVEYKWLDKALIKIKKIGIEVDRSKFNDIIIEAISAFPYWVLMGNKYYVAEGDPLNFYMDYDEHCPVCLLDKMLHRYKTLFGWSSYTYSNEFDKENMTPEVYRDRIIAHVYKNIENLVVDSSLSDKKIKELFLHNSELNKITDNIMKNIMSEILNTPLISCWVYGKEKALEDDRKNKEHVEVLKQTHEYFYEKYEEYKKSGDTKELLSHINNFLRPLSIEQLSTIYKYGFPLEDLSVKMTNNINRIIVKYIRAKEKAQKQ